MKVQDLGVFGEPSFQREYRSKVSNREEGYQVLAAAKQRNLYENPNQRHRLPDFPRSNSDSN
eukprot:22408-Hanusia_phi.AAC.1